MMRSEDLKIQIYFSCIDACPDSSIYQLNANRHVIHLDLLLSEMSISPQLNKFCFLA